MCPAPPLLIPERVESRPHTLDEEPKAVGAGLEAELLRRGEARFREATDLPALDDDAALAAWLATHPIVLERPIVVDTDSGRAVLGRPPGNVAELLP